jgi:hypothetical protein
MSRELEELDDRVNTLEQQVGGHESDGMRSDIKLIGEALEIIGRVLSDLVDAADVDAGEFAEDLERLTTIEHLVTFS